VGREPPLSVHTCIYCVCAKYEACSLSMRLYYMVRYYAYILTSKNTESSVCYVKASEAGEGGGGQPQLQNEILTRGWGERNGPREP